MVHRPTQSQIYRLKGIHPRAVDIPSDALIPINLDSPKAAWCASNVNHSYWLRLLVLPQTFTVFIWLQVIIGKEIEQVCSWVIQYLWCTVKKDKREDLGNVTSLFSLIHDTTYSNSSGHKIGSMLVESPSWWTFLEHHQQICLIRFSVQGRLYLFLKFVWLVFYRQWRR